MLSASGWFAFDWNATCLLRVDCLRWLVSSHNNNTCTFQKYSTSHSDLFLPHPNVTHLFTILLQQERIQSNANHLLAESMGYIKFEGMEIYFDLDVTFTLMYELDLINDL